MRVQEHSTVREGLVTGLIGAVLLAAWYLASDALHGRLLHTPSVLGQVFLAADTMPAVRRVVPEAVAGYSVLHVVVFLAVGVLLAWLTHLAIRHPTWRAGILIGLVVGLGWAHTFLLMAPPLGRDASLQWSVVLGSAVAVIVMLLYLWRRHPRLREEVRRVPLGDEVESPPHAPGGPRV